MGKRIAAFGLFFCTLPAISPAQTEGQIYHDVNGPVRSVSTVIYTVVSDDPYNTDSLRFEGTRTLWDYSPEGNFKGERQWNFGKPLGSLKPFRDPSGQVHSFIRYNPDGYVQDSIAVQHLCGNQIVRSDIYGPEGESYISEIIYRENGQLVRETETRYITVDHATGDYRFPWSRRTTELEYDNMGRLRRSTRTNEYFDIDEPLGEEDHINIEASQNMEEPPVYCIYSDFDEYGNWNRMDEFTDDILEFVTVRYIEYY